MKLNLIGFDPSLRNWGFSSATYDTQTKRLNIQSGGVIQYKPDSSLKQNIQDLYTANTLYSTLKPFIKNADYYVAELPTGSQSSRAMVSYALCLGVLGSLKQTNPNLFTVTPNQVKKQVKLGASKEDIIDWCITKHPSILTWLPKAKSKQEHICDSIVTLHLLTEILDEININKART